MNWKWAYSYWGGVWLLIGFLVAELAGFYRIAPWPTLSETVWHATRAHPFIIPPLFATIVFMVVHFFYHRPIWQSIAFGLVVAYSAHGLDAALP